MPARRAALDVAPALVIVGPTASGKSDVALAVAAGLGSAEIVAVDSMQVYRGMDIGTAKPTPDERSAVPHHGLDLVDPADEFTVAAYTAVIEPSIAELVSRGSTPIAVAGTGLYLRALTDTLEIPGQWPDIRAELEAAAGVDSTADLKTDPDAGAALYRRLMELDPVAAARIEPGNVRRTVRALEVTIGAGRPFSSFGPGMDTYPPIAATIVGLRWPRPVLRQRIARRVEQMLGAGLVAEVTGLIASPMSRTARQALGYKEIIDHLHGRWSLAEATEAIVLRTQQYAVRQERWFRRDPRVRWVDIDHDPVTEVRAALGTQWLPGIHS